MPYDKDEELPNNVKKLPAKKRRQWKHIFNSSFKKHGDEAKAFAMANGVAGKELDPLEIVKGYVGSWDVEQRRLTQREAAYNAVGGGSERACANCNWFVPSADSCIIVAGDIVATGLSDFWQEQYQYEPEPIPVYITNVDKQLQVNINGEWVHQTDKAFVLFKDNDRLRYIARSTNSFKDRQDEIIETAAHEEFVQWADANKQYPELWLWHSKGSRIGQADFLAVVDGFRVSSGLIDKEYEEVAYKLNKSQDIGMSHGLIARYNGKHIVRYRSFEESVLPVHRAANLWTDFSLGGDMPFTDEKKKWLSDHIGADKVEELERSTKEMSDRLKELGIEYKDDGFVVEPTTVTQEPPVNNNVDIAPLVEQMGTLVEAVAGLAGKVKALEGGMDEKIAAAFTPKNGEVPSVLRPSESATNVTDKTIAKDDTDWFAGVVQGVIANGR